MVEACQSAAPGRLAVGSATAPEAGVIYCALPDDMDRITSGEVPVTTSRRPSSSSARTAIRTRPAVEGLLHVLMVPDFERADRIGEIIR